MNLLLLALPAALWFAACCLYGLVDTALRGRDMSSGHRFARLNSWGTLGLLGIRPRVHGREHLEQHQPCVYVANHQSYLDVLVYGVLYPPRTVLIGKKQIRWIPLFGPMFVAMGNLIIDRSNRGAALKQFDRAADAIRRRRVSVWVFPEGKRVRRGEMLPFKKGAFHLAMAAGVPLVPIVMGRLSQVVDVRRLHLAGGDIGLRVLDPVHPADYGPERLEELMSEVRHRMEAARREMEEEAQ